MDRVGDIDSGGVDGDYDGAVFLFRGPVRGTAVWSPRVWCWWGPGLRRADDEPLTGEGQRTQTSMDRAGIDAGSQPQDDALSSRCSPVGPLPQAQ